MLAGSIHQGTSVANQTASATAGLYLVLRMDLVTSSLVEASSSRLAYETNHYLAVLCHLICSWIVQEGAEHGAFIL